MTAFTASPRCPSARSFPCAQIGALLLALAVAACGGTQQASGAPSIRSTYPSDTAVAVPLNAKIFASFDQSMAPLGATSFTLRQGTTPVAGTVATSADGKSSLFVPAAPLAVSTVFTATVTSGAKSSAGRALAADHTWSFTTGAVSDTVAPLVSSTSPASAGSGVATNARVMATFNKAMDPLSMEGGGFIVQQGGAAVSGSVSYGPGTVVTFTPSSSLAANTAFTATLSTGVKDIAGNALASAFPWTFTTGTSAALGPAAVGLGTSANYAILAKTAISSVPASSVTGDIGLGPAAASYITGFSLVADSSNTFSTSPQIVGKAYAADYAPPTPANLTTAVANMESAYTDAAGRPTPDYLELGTGNIGGKTLAPGLYKWTSTVTIPSDVTFAGGANDVWILQTTGDLNLAAAQHVTLSGGAQAKNIYWQVAGKTVFGANSHFEGILLCKTDVTLQTGSTMNGRVLAQTQVALQQATVTQP